MSGAIVSLSRKWMVAGWVYRGVVESAANHVPLTTPALKSILDESMGMQFIHLDHDFSDDELRAFLQSLRDGYRQTEIEGPVSFHDADAYPGYLQRFGELIALIEDEVAERDLAF